jgi:hypothetical protein
MATTTASSPTSLLAAMAAATPTKPKKASRPELHDADLDDLAIKMDKAISALKNAEAVKSTVADQLRSAVLPRLIAACRAAGSIMSSIVINGKVTMVRVAKYSKLAPEHVEEIRKTFGADADRYVATQYGVSLKPEAVGDETIIQRLMDCFGDKFGEIFSVTQESVITDAFHMDVTLKPEVAEQAQPLIEMGVIRPQSPHFTA